MFAKTSMSMRQGVPRDSEEKTVWQSQGFELEKERRTEKRRAQSQSEKQMEGGGKKTSSLVLFLIFTD